MNASDQSLLFLLLNNARYSKKLILQQLDEQGKSLPFNLLANIDAQGNTLVELGQRLQCSKQEITRLVQQAEKKQWLEVKPDPKDKRAKRVCLSQTGQTLLKQGVDLYHELEQELIGDWPAEQQHSFKQQLLELNQNLKKQVKR